MPKVLDQELYDAVKEYSNTIYKKPSAYRSAWIVRTYQALGGKYGEDGKPRKLSQWLKEDWKNLAKKGQYPVLRPTVKVNDLTPLTPSEIDPANLKKQIETKQKIKGSKNLSPFLKK
jgi:hypothetical protein